MSMLKERAFSVVNLGVFYMGSHLSAEKFSKKYGGAASNWLNEFPLHRVLLSHTYLIQKFPVTVAEYAEFVAATHYVTRAEQDKGAYVWVGEGWDLRNDATWRNPYFRQEESHPVVCISWHDAIEYCNWLSSERGYHPCYTKTVEGITCDFDSDILRTLQLFVGAKPQMPEIYSAETIRQRKKQGR